ncbi:hypothetical protein DFH07DRAFT_816067 [Mycena maculata]|uniref:Uncharacterized protein n=1 Tax=Mycena maculata TaxID=230809 RepID=A0AAD7JE86_9AGAR|nr:hypothetical protein DFH07DRAFT_842301 [Mycena maculata]KAJ7760889.1 hypothetical protein DFH07DRAFT_816067 [Mycena maculata]
MGMNSHSGADAPGTGGDARKHEHSALALPRCRRPGRHRQRAPGYLDFALRQARGSMKGRPSAHGRRRTPALVRIRHIPRALPTTYRSRVPFPARTARGGAGCRCMHGTAVGPVVRGSRNGEWALRKGGDGVRGNSAISFPLRTSPLPFPTISIPSLSTTHIHSPELISSFDSSNFGRRGRDPHRAPPAHYGCRCTFRFCCADLSPPNAVGRRGSGEGEAQRCAREGGWAQEVKRGGGRVWERTRAYPLGANGPPGAPECGVPLGRAPTLRYLSSPSTPSLCQYLSSS